MSRAFRDMGTTTAGAKCFSSHPSMNPKSRRSSPQRLIPCPQKCRRTDQHRRNQMRVHQPDSGTIQSPRLNHPPYFAELRDSHPRQSIKQRQGPGTIPQRSQRQFRSDQGMDRDIPALQLLTQFFVARAQVVDPDRGVGENHFRPALRRGTLFSPGIVPPRDASRRALSRSIRALSASRINAVFSATPVNS